MRRLRPALFLVALAALAIVARPASSDDERIKFLFRSREQLHRQLEDHVGKEVTTTDRLVMVYTDAPGGNLFFDTHYFRCAIPASAEGADYIKKTFAAAKLRFKDLQADMAKASNQDAREAIARKVYARWKEKALVTLFGKIDRPEFWGKVADDAKGAGVASERIVFVVEKAEKPRKRWYDEID
jgi:hypothetical protein